MKIGLVNAPIILSDELYHYIPLGILTIAGILEDISEIEIIDINKLITKRKIRIDSLLPQVIADFLLERCFDVVGFSTLSTSYSLTLRIAERVKSQRKGTFIIFGGPQATFTHYETLQNFSFIDVIVRGEGEVIIKNLINNLKENKVGKLKNVKGITYKECGKIKINPPEGIINDFNKLPIPAYHLYPYLHEFNEYIPVEVGRGCPIACDFCATSLYWQKKPRFKSIDRILQEVELLYSKFGIKDIEFHHDNLNLNNKFIIELCNRIILRKLKFSWGITATAKSSSLHSYILKLLYDANCKRIFFGIESGSPRIQKKLLKKINIEDAEKVIKNTVEVGITPTTSFIIGFPSETKKELEATLELIVRTKLNGANPQCHVLCPYAGTKLYYDFENKLKFDGNITDMSACRLFEDDVKMIKSFKSLFSCFYYIPTVKISRTNILDCSLFINLSLGFYKNFLWAWKYIQKYKIMDLAFQWGNYCRRNDLFCNRNFNPNLHLKELNLSVLQFLNHFLKKKRLKKTVKNILLYELGKAAISFNYEDFDRTYKIGNKKFWVHEFDQKISTLQIDYNGGNFNIKEGKDFILITKINNSLLTISLTPSIYLRLKKSPLEFSNFLTQFNLI